MARGPKLLRYVAFVAALAGPSSRAELLSAYFPTGVPGYGAAPGVTVTSRVRPEYDSPGVRVGGFIARPLVEQGVAYDDNVFGGAQKRGSWVVGTHPSLLANSDWSRNRVGAYVGLDDFRFLNQPTQSRTNWAGSLGGALAIGRDELTLAAAHFALHQDRTELDALPSDTPVAYNVNDIRAAYTITLNRVSITPGASFTTYRYDNTTILGAPAPQSYRDRNVTQPAVVTRYELTPQRNIVVVIRAIDSHYVEPQIGQPTRNSVGYQALAGLEDDSDAVWRYRVLIGWEVRNFVAAQYRSHQAPTAEAVVIWSPSGLTTVTGTLTQSIEDAAQETIVGYAYTAARFAMDHEYRRDLLLHAAVGVQRAVYLQGGGQSAGFTVGASVTWLLNRHMRVSASYDFTDQRGNNNPAQQTTGSYTRGIGLLTVRFGL